jgi:hypothetical protein
MSRLSPLLAAGALLAVGASPVHADTYCIAKPACAGAPGGHAAASLPAGIAAASAHPGPDRIEIGPGTFPFAGPGAPAVTAGDDITAIAGAGRDATILTAGPSGQVALNVQSPGTVVSDLGIALPDGVDSQGLTLVGAGAVARRVDVEGPHATTSSEGIGASGGAVLDDVRVALNRSVNIAGVYVYGSGGATLAGVEITAGSPLRVNSGASQTTVSRSRLTGLYTGAYVQSPSELDVVDSLVDVSAGAYEAIAVYGGPSGTTTTARVTRSTLVGHGPAVQVNQSLAGGTAKAVLRAVAVVGDGTPFARNQSAGTASLDVDRSAFRPGYTPGPADAFGTHNQGAPDGFVAPADGDYRLRYSSSLVDAGGQTLLPGSAKDLAGGRRVVDGKGDGGAQADIGAFEYQRSAPAFQASASTGAAPAGTPIAFLMSNVTDADPGEVPTLRWDFSDGSSSAGASASHAFGVGPGGSISATATATDPVGLTTTKTLHAEIVPVAGGPGTGTGTGAPTPAPAAPKPGATTPPAATSVRVAGLRLGAHGRLRVRVTCAGPRACRGRVAIRAKRGGRTVTVAGGAFTLQAGKSRTLALAVGRKQRAALPRGRRTRLTATATGRDALGTALTSASVTATVRR